MQAEPTQADSMPAGSMAAEPALADFMPADFGYQMDNAEMILLLSLLEEEHSVDEIRHILHSYASEHASPENIHRFTTLADNLDECVMSLLDQGLIDAKAGELE